MRIALLASLLGVEATGQSAVPAVTAARLASAGHQVTILATDCAVGGGPVKKYVQVPEEVTVRIFPSVGKMNRRLFRSPPLITWLRQHISEFDVLDVQGTWSFVGRDAAKVFDAAGKPYVLTPHGMMTRYDWQKSMLKRKFFFKFGFGKIWANADSIRFLSTGEREQSFHPAMGPSAIVPNFIDLPAASTLVTRLQARQVLGLAPESRMLLFLGRLVHQKGVKEILSAFEIAAARMPELYLFLVGPSEGEYGAEIIAQVASSAFRDRIRLPGSVSGETKDNFLRAADAFITLSYNEGQSFAHLEAMGEALPMVLTASSNMDRLLEYGAGLLSSHEPPVAAQAILNIFEDETIRVRMGSNARRLVTEHYTPQVVIPQLVSLYEEIIQGRRTRGRC